MPQPTIKELRVQTRMTQKQFAEHFGFRVRTLQGWEQGKQPPEGTVQMITRILQLEAEIKELANGFNNHIVEQYRQK